MNEADLARMLMENREAFIGWLQISVFLTIAIFVLAYLLRGVPIWVRAALFGVLLIGSFNLFMVMNATNAGFLNLAQDLAGSTPSLAFSKGVIEALGATPTGASLPPWAVIGAPLILILNLAIGFQLLLLQKWER